MISDRIQELRKLHNMTQSELAKKLNITRSSVNAWELDISTPSTNTVIELARIFRVSTDYILLGTDNINNISLEHLSEEKKKLILNLLDIFSEDDK